MKARIQVWDSVTCMERYHGTPDGPDFPPNSHDGLLAEFEMNPHNASEWNVLRERMLLAVEARMCIVVSG